MAKASLFYIVKKGENLDEIALRNGTTAGNLRKINGMNNTEQPSEGQRIALSAKAVCKVKVLLIDKDHNPISGAKMRLEYNGKSKILTTGPCGILPSIITKSPKDIVKISIGRANGSWELLQAAPSDWGNKLVTCKSKATKYEGETMEHPKDAKGNPIRDPKETDKKPVKPSEQPESTEAKGKPHSDYGDGKGQKSVQEYDKNGLPVKKVSNDQEKLDFLKSYNGDKISDEDYIKAANKLKIEIEIFLAIEAQESKRNAFDKKKRPTILYERHWFSKLTKRKYDKSNSDISCKKAYTSDRFDKKGKAIPDAERYGDNQYKRLAKAYKLSPEIALQSCSWGKYQIMGFNYITCGYSSVRDFVAMMSESERKQLDAVTKFIEKNCLKAARNKNWKEIARAYNGDEYWIKGYDKQLKEKYDQIVAKRRKK